jgi:hypothetical protein
MEKNVAKFMVFNGEDFGYWKKLNSQLSLEPGSCYLGDRTGDVRDPGNTRQCGPRCANKV